MSSKKKSSKQQKQQQPKDIKKKKVTQSSYYRIIILLLVVITYLDVLKGGSWKESKTGQAFERFGISEYSYKVLNKTSEGIRWVNSEIDKQFPGYEKKLYETLEPYSELASDLGVITYKILLKYHESLLALMKKYQNDPPYIVEQISGFFENAVTNLSNFTRKGLKYLQEEVFVGNLAPDQVGKVLIELVNNGVQKVNEFYIWGYEKVRTLLN